MTYVQTLIAESDGTTCPRGWYFFVMADCLAAGCPVSFGPFNQRSEAQAARDKFMLDAALPEPSHLKRN